MVTFEFLLKGQVLELTNRDKLGVLAPVSDTVNYYRCKFTLTFDWVGLASKTVSFKNMSSNVSKRVVLGDDGYCFVPWEVLSHTGVILMNVVGVTPSSCSVEQRLTTNPFELFVQVDEGEIDASVSNPPTPTEYEQWVNQIKNYASSAIASKNAAVVSEANALSSARSASASEASSASSAASAASSLVTVTALSKTAAQAASSSEDNSTLSRSWAVGDTNSRSGEAIDNSKYYSERSSASASAAAASATAANTSMGTASAAQTSAVNANNSAQEAARNAVAADASAGLSKQAAETAANNASVSASSASASASNSSASATASGNSAVAANTSAIAAADSSSLASSKSLLSQSWAVGGTGSRTGEDTNNAKYWSEQSAAGQLQANWTEMDTSSKAFIRNKPATFSPSVHTHDDRYYTETEIDTFLSGKSSTGHTHTKSNITDFAHVHDDRYYTESETDALLLGKSDVTHLHDDRYYTGTAIDSSLSAKADLENGKVPASQLPAYVDDVLEYVTVSAFPTTGESGKIYIAQDTNLTYRWTGSGYAEISQSLALGETASTAFRGDQGKVAYEHTSDSIKHITAAERTSWNGKLDSAGAKSAVGLAQDLDYTITASEYASLVALLGAGHNRLIDWLMPVGHIIYTLSSSFDPNVLYTGTTWIKLEGIFLLGSSADYPLSSIGGSADAVVVAHTHTQASHHHDMGKIWSNGSGSASVYQYTDNRTAQYRYTSSATPAIYSAGVSGGGMNMPPYKVVNIWQRTA